MHTKQNRGFTLIELMIVVVIIAILAAIAIPSYREHVCKVERNQAKADLMGLAQAMERYYTTNNFSYLAATAGTSGTVGYSDKSPIDSTKRFDLSIDASSLTKAYFKVQATRSDGNCGDGPYTIDSAGSKSTNWSQ